VEVHRGIALNDLLQRTHKQWRLRDDIAHGSIFVRRGVLEHVQFTSVYKGQDTMMIRDVLYYYGRDDNAAMFINRPLTSYYQASHSNKDLK